MKRNINADLRLKISDLKFINLLIYFKIIVNLVMENLAF